MASKLIKSTDSDGRHKKLVDEALARAKSSRSRIAPSPKLPKPKSAKGK